MRPYDAGMARGQADAQQVLNLEYHSEMMRCCGGDIPDIESLPLGDEGRREWLLGYANGIASEVSGEEIHLVWK
jgi:hypothetical protein